MKTVLSESFITSDTTYVVVKREPPFQIIFGDKNVFQRKCLKM